MAKVTVYNDEDEIEWEEELGEIFVISEEEARQLWDFLSHEFINPEFYPHVHTMIKRLVDYVDN